MSSNRGEGQEGGNNEDVEADEALRDSEGRIATGEEGEDTEEPDVDFGDYMEPGSRYEVEAEEADVEQGQVHENGLDVASSTEEEDALQLMREHDQELRDVGPDSGPITPVNQSPLASPIDSGSIPDDTPSVQGSLASSLGRMASPGSRKTVSRTPSGALQPFERRFETRLSASPTASPRAQSPAFLSPHSRQISLSSRISGVSSQDEGSGADTPQAPWDVIRWTKLRKITGQAFSEVGKRNFGRPTCMAVSALIAIGTSKGLVLGFDYHQTLKIIIGQGTKATECGSVTALTVSADYSTIASGHANGHIFTWEINRPARPFLQIPTLDRSLLQQSQHPDGHLPGSAILHIGFLGTRHTALVSADAAGMAFSHLATRGLGPVTRTIRTTRLLGRYPAADPQAERVRKPSSILAFSPLPLGNVEQATDGMGLTALLTPYLLVIVSTTPIAQTQHKCPRPKEISPHSTLSGCLAWFPAVKLKSTSTDVDKGISDTKLVYCWSNVLTILDVKVVENDKGADPQKPPSLEFRPRSRWRAEEAIVAIQWLGRSVLGVLTISQRLLILEDATLQVTDSIDLLQRHIYHQDLFSHQLHAVVEQLNTEDPSLHGVVADAFYMSYKVYKGRAFLLGFNDLTVGTLSNWADRLMALMETGDHIAAIRLATDYYSGSANNVTIGLPDNDSTRHEMVRERLLAMISASMNYTFSQQDDQREVRLKELVEVCFEACVTMKETDYLFADVFDWFQEADEKSVFISTLEPYVLDGEVQMLPPEVVKAVVAHFIEENQASRLEELLCRLDPHSFDLDQITVLCQQHSLYDALIYIWTQAIGDYVTPLINLLSLVKMLQQGDEDEDLCGNPFYKSAAKVYPYLAYSLTSRRYPSGNMMDDLEASRAKTDLYSYLFAGTPIAWPQRSEKIFRTADNPEDEPAFPYLGMLLQFDAPAFMSVLNEAFEDSFLNEAEDDSGVNGDSSVNGTSERQVHKKSRQQIIEIMLDVMRQGDFEPVQVIYLDMFVARSLPKYPGQLILSGTLLNSVLQRLCKPPADGLRDDCELSVEYLLSAYHPPNIPGLIEAVRSARFYRVLKSVYRGERMLTELLETYFEDPTGKENVFDCIALCFRASTALNEKQLQSVKQVITNHVQELADIEVVQTSRTLAASAAELLESSVNALSDSYQQFVFLRALLEPGLLRDRQFSSSPLKQDQQSAFTEQYVQLMCRHDPTHVADYIKTLPSSDLRLDEVLPAMESSGVIDAAVALLARDGLARDAMDRLVTHMKSLEDALTSLIDTAAARPDVTVPEDTTEELVEDIEKYTKVGIWLCQGQSATAQRRPRPRTNLAWEVSEDDLDLDEYLWLNLTDVIVQVTQNATAAFDHLDSHPTNAQESFDSSRLASSLRSSVQQAFTALMASTATPSIKSEQDSLKQSKQPSDHMSFLRVLRAFLARAARTAPSLADLRAVLQDILSAYAFEQGVLSLANELLGSDVFSDIQEANTLRQRGWRPRSQVCERCKRRAWGTGIGEVVWDEWVTREQEREAERTRKMLERGGGEQARRLSRGKAKVPPTPTRSSGDDGEGEETKRMALVVFACRHVFHRVCLDEGKGIGGGYNRGGGSSGGMYRCPVCTEQR
ncbi:related to VPS8-vacuolar sorting, 134 kD [Lecanosticta acicola]|uniref:Related to VPS8-vacuolar sorting, 134 kD n=1 Tax=Lecanosticta acicola TaxID=111012 RepID=A0AAI9EBY3_9PEZI|nr:related to VPS8-vacuolar sorting, 134 kD [Lecanosticta acicola]